MWSISVGVIVVCEYKKTDITVCGVVVTFFPQHGLSSVFRDQEKALVSAVFQPLLKLDTCCK